MNTKGLVVYFAILFGFVLPCVALSFVKDRIPHQNLQTEPTQLTIEEKRFVRVKLDTGEVAEIEESEYILGVVLQEMPLSFETEALKAQAVVARTYARRKQLVAPKHVDADVCTDPSCCQGYCSPDSYTAKGFSAEDVDRVRRLVNETGRLVLTYNGEPIDATYFSCSGGMTEDAAAVWGAAVPYLQSTESPGEEGASHYSDTVQFSLQSFQVALNVKLSGDRKNWIRNMVYTSGGGVASIEIGGRTFSGTEIRELLSLRSTCFMITIVDNTVTVTTKGFGHRVGMSQYGADAMALNGSSYKEILMHYYKDTRLEDMG